MRLLVCGGRAYGITMKDFKGSRHYRRLLESENKTARTLLRQTSIIHDVLNRLDTAGIGRGDPIMHIAHGDASGADAVADEWAKDRGIAVTPYPAEWDIHGRAAGPIRNAKMHDEFKPNIVIGFPGGAGTSGMLKIARESGIARVFRVEETTMTEPKRVVAKPIMKFIGASAYAPILYVVTEIHSRV